MGLNRGFIALPLTAWLAIGGSILLLGALGYARVQTVRLEAAQERLEAIRIAGEEAQRAADAQAKRDKLRKEQADAENKRTTDNLNATIKRLRDANPTSGGSVSPNPAASKCPDGYTCFDKAEYQRTDGEFVKGARGLADEGATVETDLNTAKKWAATY